VPVRPPVPGARGTARLGTTPPGTTGPDSTGPGTTGPASRDGSRFAGLAERPVAEHVAVYEAEHERLQRELSTIDQL
jgi:hypothetical protein